MNGIISGMPSMTFRSSTRAGQLQDLGVGARAAQDFVADQGDRFGMIELDPAAAPAAASSAIVKIVRRSCSRG